MADNVIVRVPEQQFIRGEDGYSPEVTIEDIAHGHSVTITDRDHPTGQSFNVMDGDSAYEQAVAGGYTGTEAQFNEELASFKELSDEMKEVAPFYAEYGVTTKAEIEAAINNKRQIYLNRGGGLGGVVAPYTGTFLYADIWGEGTGYRFARTNGNWQYVYELKSEWTYSIYDLTAPAQRAETAAAQALTRMNSADASAQAAAGSAGDASAAATTATTKAGEASDSATAADGSAKDAEAYAIGKRNGTDVGSTDPAYHNNAKYYAEQAASSASDAVTAKGAAETAQGKAEDAQEAAEQAQEAAEAVLESIPADYTELSEDVDELKSAIAYQELPFVIPTKRYGFNEESYHISFSQNVRCSKMYTASGESVELSFSNIPICRILCFDANYNFLGRIDMSSNTPVSFLTNTKYVMLKVAVTSGNVTDDAWSSAHPVIVKSGIAPKLINDNTIVAPYNTTEEKKMRADYVGNGTDDRRCLHIAINVSYYWGEKTILLEGDYILNSFSDGDAGGPKVCLYTGVSTPNTQFETQENFYQIEGEVMPFAYKKGAIIHLGETLYNSLGNDDTLSLLRGVKIQGAVPNGNRVGALSVKNLIFRLPGNQKKVTCLDFNYSHSAICEHVNCIAVDPDEGYGYISPTNMKAPPVPVEGCNGILGTFGSCWNTNTVFRNIECIGFYIGFDVSGEHMLVENASMKYNWYGFTFSHCQKLRGNPRHPIVCLNLLDEHNFNMPLFDQTADQPIYIIGLNLMYASIITFEGHSGTDFDRSEHNRAVDVGGQTRGFVYYNNVTPKDGLFGANQVFPAFFQTPNQGMRCVNSRHRLAASSQDIQVWEANYMQEVFDTTLNKKLIYNGTNWVDMNGVVAY